MYYNSIKATARTTLCKYTIPIKTLVISVMSICGPYRSLPFKVLSVTLADGEVDFSDIVSAILTADLRLTTLNGHSTPQNAVSL